MDLNEALMKMVMYCDSKVFVEILLRDENGCVTGRKEIPIARIKPNWDGGGVRIQVEDSEIQKTTWKE